MTPNHLVSSFIIFFFVVVMLLIVVIVPSYVKPKHDQALSRELQILYNNMYSSVVSLNTPSYVDDNLDRRFVCSGVILTQHWILAGDDCFVYSKDWVNLQVRAGSELWSGGGTQHNISRMVRLFKEGPAVFKVDPSFTFNNYIQPVKLVHDSFEWTNAYCVHWYNPNQRKNKKYVEEIWSKYPCYFDNKIGIMKQYLSFNIKAESSPLMTTDRFLIGYKLGIDNRQTKSKIFVFLDLQHGEYKTWLDRLILDGEPADNVDDFEDNIDFNSTILLYGANRQCLSITTSAIAGTVKNLI